MPAAVDATQFGKIVDPIMAHIVTPILGVLFLIGLCVFVWGIAEMIIRGDDPAARKTGRLHMLSGAFGMFIMFSAWGIIRLISSTIGSIGH